MLWLVTHAQFFSPCAQSHADIILESSTLPCPLHTLLCRVSHALCALGLDLGGGCNRGLVITSTWL